MSIFCVLIFEINKFMKYYKKIGCKTLLETIWQQNKRIYKDDKEKPAMR